MSLDKEFRASDKKRLTHDQCRLKVCVLCVKKKPSVRPISSKVRDLIQCHIPGLNFENDTRLPNAICNNCRGALQDSSKSHLLPEPQDYTKFTIQCPSPSSPHNDATCLVCKLGRMDAITAKKLASMAAARKIGDYLDLCSECLDYKTEGCAHDCQLSQLPKESIVERPTTSQVPPKSEAKTGSYGMLIGTII